MESLLNPQINESGLFSLCSNLGYTQEDLGYIKLILTHFPRIFVFLSVESPGKEIPKLIILLKHLSEERKVVFLQELATVTPLRISAKMLSEIESLPLLEKLSLFSTMKNFDNSPSFSPSFASSSSSSSSFLGNILNSFLSPSPQQPQPQQQQYQQQQQQPQHQQYQNQYLPPLPPESSQPPPLPPRSAQNINSYTTTVSSVNTNPQYFNHNQNNSSNSNNNNININIPQNIPKYIPQQSYQPHSSSSSSTYKNNINSPGRLSKEQLEEFYNNGFLVIPNVVNQQLISLALSAINRFIGRGIPDNHLGEMYKLAVGGLGYWPELAHTDTILNLVYGSPLHQYINHLLGETHKCYTGQIALRFPGDGCFDTSETPQLHNLLKLGQTIGKFFGASDEQLNKDISSKHPHLTNFTFESSWASRWHIDGLSSVPNQVVVNQKVMQFTLLVGVLLSDAHLPFSGNLTVYPGGHRVIQNEIHRRMIPPSEILVPNSQLPPISLPEPHQVIANAGDVVLCHYQMPHTIAPNASPNIRYCVYFRIEHKSRVPGVYRPEAMSDIWLEFDGIRPILPNVS